MNLCLLDVNLVFLWLTKGQTHFAQSRNYFSTTPMHVHTLGNDEWNSGIQTPKNIWTKDTSLNLQQLLWVACIHSLEMNVEELEVLVSFANRSAFWSDYQLCLNHSTSKQCN